MNIKKLNQTLKSANSIVTLDDGRKTLVEQRCVDYCHRHDLETSIEAYKYVEKALNLKEVKKILIDKAYDIFKQEIRKKYEDMKKILEE